jgi:hypothetical protein
MRLDELFDVKNGIASSAVKVLPHKIKGCIPYVRPASTQQRTLAGWVKRDDLEAENIYPVGSLFISTDGEGSHTYSYVSNFEFVPNSNVSVLIPKNESMTLQEKIYYARCITLNRYRFSYGRKPKGDRLKSIPLPANAPEWVNDIQFDMLNGTDAPALNQTIPSLEIIKWKPYLLADLFTIKKGKRLTKASMSKGIIPYIGSTDSNNGVTAYIGQDATHKENTISLSYNGSVGEAFYQPSPFWATDDVNVLYPKFEMTSAIALFICTIIRLEKYRYNYGRKWVLEKMNECVIKLPVNEAGNPDWTYMENYINALPYSSQLQPSHLLPQS